MITGRRSTDWLAPALVSQNGNGDRRKSDRRGPDRRAPRRRIDALFAMTLVNHVMEEAPVEPKAYEASAPAPRAGIVVNVKA